MLYLLKLTSKTHGNQIVSFGSFDDVQAHAERNEDRFNADFGPAHYDDMEARVSQLQEKINRWNSDLIWLPTIGHKRDRTNADLENAKAELEMILPHLDTSTYAIAAE